ncbi:hypothetical protein FKG94_12505 [Exilibacterium tricleocarpae]|uniref:alpha-L-fucosidase n=1 Tax=Exilibacterium tricleocarpae TaxID=2591008 RepID=A0A545TNQ2_9GAMM|nr:alpha-L-fucosidase [Exilibacterium tricleocarpae]TQV78836.1 hypothetical protein FKG94_12505 [Exilibacterium tricleocarpae]
MIGEHGNKILTALVALLAIAAYTSAAPEVPDDRSNPTVPTLAEKQLGLVNDRYLAYFHYGMNVFDTGGSPKEDWGSGKVPVSAWRPQGNDPAQWAKVAKEAGMKGGILTTKHMDGFALWDSKAIVTWDVEGETVGEETTYDVAGYDHPDLEFDTVDVVREFVDAFRAEDMRVGLYFCVTDLHHDIQAKAITPEKIEFVKQQFTEILTQYGPLDYVNIDGYVETPPQTSAQEIPYKMFYDLVQEHQPGALIINHNYMGNYATTEAPFLDSINKSVDRIFPDDYLDPKAISETLSNKWFYWPGVSKLKKREWKSIAEKLNAINAINGTLVLNLSPNRSGRLDDDVAPLLGKIRAAWNDPDDLAQADPSWGYSYDVSENLAFQKPTRQSGSYPRIWSAWIKTYPWIWRLALRGGIAVDGQSNGNAKFRQVSMTSASRNSWWEVDLQGEFDIGSVEVVNRNDCCQDKLAPYKVEIRNRAGDITWSETKTEAPRDSTRLDVGGARGAFVRITLMRRGKLQLAEVIVREK